MTQETELPAVKVLEWLSDREPFFATTPFCRYRIVPVHDDTGPHWETTVTYQGSTYRRSETEVEAKGAAQADYEQRIRSALVPSTPAESRCEKAENERLRHIVSDCAAALVSGAYISPKASIEFMDGLPKEISLVVSGLRTRCEKAEAKLAEAKASRDLQARIASDEEGLSRAAESKCEELVKALEPFAREADTWPDDAAPDDYVVKVKLSTKVIRSRFTVGDLRRARDVLGKQEG